MNIESYKSLKENNAGISLVELIVAVAMSTIIAGAVSGLLMYSTRVYRNETVNASMQYEIQTNINQITDAIMSSQSMFIGENSTGTVPFTNYAAFGTFGTTDCDVIVLVAGTPNVSTNRFKIYLDRVHTLDGTPKNTVDKAVARIKKAEADGVTPNPYLLGEYATSFRIEPKKKVPADATNPYLNFETVSGNKLYTNPIELEVELDFERDATGKTVNKHVQEDVYMRNTVKTDIYFGEFGSEDTYKYSKGN